MMRHGDCPRCGDDALTSYNPACSVFLAWVALEDPRAAEAMGGAIDEVRESLIEQGGWVDASRGNPFVRMAEEVEAQLAPGEAFTVNGGVITLLPRPPISTTIGIAAENLQPGDLVEYTLGGPPTQPVRRISVDRIDSRIIIGTAGEPIEVPRNGRLPRGFTLYAPRHPGGWPYVEEDAITTSRQHSDARGMGAVEDEARTRNEERALEGYLLESVTV
jgi:hypothetical protein